jgi:hypothetical protein
MTTQSIPGPVATLAANLYQHAMELDEMPFVGTIAEYAETNEKLARDAVQQLHDFLTLFADQLDDEWSLMMKNTSTYSAWEAHTS